MRRFILVGLLLLSACAQAAPESHVNTPYPDGIYRGTYYDYSTEQLAVEFEMKNQRFESIRFIGMRYRDGDYLSRNATQAQQAIVAQYQTVADFLLRKGVDSLTNLYKEPTIIPDVDAVTGATLKTSAVVSAIYDGLSRMPYSWDKSATFVFDTPVCDGRYRGFFYENGIEQIAVEFELKDQAFVLLQIRSIRDEQGAPCNETSRAYQTVSRCLEYLKNRPISALTELDDVVARMTFGDSIMCCKLRCAIFGGLSRAPFQSDNASHFFESLSAGDGTYRGHYYDNGIEKLSVQFEVEDGRLHNISLRRKQDNMEENVQIEAYEGACLLLEGKPVNVVNSLYSLSDASFEAGELTYAIADALTRGPYKLSSASLLPAAQNAAEGIQGGRFISDGLVIEVELELEQDKIILATLTRLKVNAVDIEGEEQSKLFLEDQLKKLEGKPVSQINELYHLGHPFALPLVSALWDAVEAK